MSRMKIMAGLLLLGCFVFAEDEDPMLRCDMTNESCVQKCDQSENVSPECYEKCDNTYYKCLDVANGYVQESEAPKPKKDAEEDR